MKQPICSVSDIPASDSRVMPFLGREVHVYLEGGRPRAAVNTCLHLGGPLEFKQGCFICPWRGAEFGTDGACRKGGAAAGSRLMFLPVRVEDGVLHYVWGE